MHHSNAAVIGLVIVAALWISPVAAFASDVPAGGRSWELITPKDPIAAHISAVFPIENADSPVAYSAIGALPAAPSGAPLGAGGVSVRGDTEWINTSLGFPYSNYSEDIFDALVPIQPIAFTDDRRSSVWLSNMPLTPDAPPEGESALYLRTPDGAPHLIAPTSSTLFGEHGALDISKDGREVVISSDLHLLPADAGRTSGRSLYRWTDDDLQLIDVDDGGSLLSSCGSLISSSAGISADTGRVFFVNPGQTSCPGPKRVYLRELNGPTTEISASNCTRDDCNAAQHVAFAGATPNGALAFLTTTQQLTNDDIDAARDLYRYDVEGGDLTLLTPDQPEADGAIREEAVQVAEDGQRVYLFADGRLVTGEGPTSGRNIYVAAADGLHFVAPGPTSSRIQLSDDGGCALLSTMSALAEGDTDEREDVYLYDHERRKFTWLSHSAIGGNGPTAAHIRTPLEDPLFFNLNTIGAPGRAISRDCGTAFFSTSEQLVPEDVNGQVDVYEWSGGDDLGLMTSGTGSDDVRFGGISPSGRTALFDTTETITPDDRDGGELDIYAARVGGFSIATPSLDEDAVSPFAPSHLVRSTPASALPLERTPQGRRIRLLGIRWMRRDSSAPRIGLVVRLPFRGRVAALVWTKRGGKRVVLARGAAGAARPGKTRVTLRLSRVSRLALMRRGFLRGRLLVRQADHRLSRPLRLRWRR